MLPIGRWLSTPAVITTEKQRTGSSTDFNDRMKTYCTSYDEYESLPCVCMNEYSQCIYVQMILIRIKRAPNFITQSNKQIKINKNELNATNRTGNCILYTMIAHQRQHNSIYILHIYYEHISTSSFIYIIYSAYLPVLLISLYNITTDTSSTFRL